jgi:hypothetical protein
MKWVSMLGAASLATALSAALLIGGCGGNDNMTAPDQTVSFDGKVKAIEGLHLDLSGGWSVVIDGATQVVRNGQRITLHDVSIGERVEGMGQFEADGQTVLARKINAL